MAQGEDKLNRSSVWRDLDCDYSQGLPALLKELNISLIFTAYQAGRLILIRSDGEKLDVEPIPVERPMGISTDKRRLTLGSFSQILTFVREDGLIAQLKKPLLPIEEDRTAPRIKSEKEQRLEAANEHSGVAQETDAKEQQIIPGHRKQRHQAVDQRVDACFIARSAHYSGMINTHDIAWGNDGLWVVNSSFSCLCTVDPNWSFVPRWKPHFISELKPEDRCHLNGMALRDGKPAYATTFSKDDGPSMWRSAETFDGTLIDVAANRILIDGLVLPHSPRWHEKGVFYCNSGLGQICVYEPDTGNHSVLSEVPGFTRGMDIHGSILFVGLSRARETRVSRPTPLSRKSDITRCGISLIHVKTGEEMGSIRFPRNVDQIYDVAVIPDCSFPELLDPTHPRMRNHFVHDQLQPLEN